MAHAHTAQDHSLTTRLTHWGTTIAFIMLFGSGAAIFNHSPKFKVFGRTLVLPHLPAWLAIPFAPKIMHYVFAAIFVLCGILYLVWGLRSGHFSRLIVRGDDVRKALPMQLYYLGLKKTPPSYRGYNPLQKIAYTTLLFVISPLIVLSGTALLPIHALRPLGTLFFGGAKLWHFGLMWAVCAFVVVHVGMVASTGLVANIRAMTSTTVAPGAERAEMRPATHTIEQSLQ